MEDSTLYSLACFFFARVWEVGAFRWRVDLILMGFQQSEKFIPILCFPFYKMHFFQSVLLAFQGSYEKMFGKSKNDLIFLAFVVQPVINSF